MLYYVFYIVASTIKDNKCFQGSRIESASGLTSAFASKHHCLYSCSFLKYFKVLPIKPPVIQITFFIEMILIRRWWQFRSWTATGNIFFLCVLQQSLSPLGSCSKNGTEHDGSWTFLQAVRIVSCSHRVEMQI